MSIEKGELLHGTLYEMFLKSRAREQIEAYCRRSGEDLDEVSSKFMAYLLDQHPDWLKIEERQCVDECLLWQDTLEGHGYWNKVTYGR